MDLGVDKDDIMNKGIDILKEMDAKGLINEGNEDGNKSICEKWKDY